MATAIKQWASGPKRKGVAKIGEIRERKGGQKWKKIAKGKWARLPKKGEKPEKKEPEKKEPEKPELCGAKGPSGQKCTRPKGHPGTHAGAGKSIGKGVKVAGKAEPVEARKYKVWSGKAEAKPMGRTENLLKRVNHFLSKRNLKAVSSLDPKTMRAHGKYLDAEAGRDSEASKVFRAFRFLAKDATTVGKPGGKSEKAWKNSARILEKRVPELKIGKREWRPIQEVPRELDPLEAERIEKKRNLHLRNIYTNPKPTPEEAKWFAAYVKASDEIAEKVSGENRDKLEPEKVRKMNEFTKKPEDVIDRFDELQDRFIQKSNLPEEETYYSHPRLKIQSRNDLEPEDLAIVDAITLFSDGNVETVRDPQKFDPSKAMSAIEGVRYLGGRYRNHNPDKEAYTRANEVMKALATHPVKEPEVIYRGITVPDAAITSFRKGTTVKGKEISSWSFAEKRARSFATGHYIDKATGQRERGTRVLFRMKRPARGTDITSLSSYPDEREFISGGDYKITRGTIDEKGFYIFDVEQVE